MVYRIYGIATGKAGFPEYWPWRCRPDAGGGGLVNRLMKSWLTVTGKRNNQYCDRLRICALHSGWPRYFCGRHGHRRRDSGAVECGAYSAGYRRCDRGGCRSCCTGSPRRVVSGAMILAFKPFKMGDVVRYVDNDITGTIEEITPHHAGSHVSRTSAHYPKQQDEQCHHRER